MCNRERGLLGEWSSEKPRLAPLCGVTLSEAPPHSGAGALSVLQLTQWVVQKSRLRRSVGEFLLNFLLLGCWFGFIGYIRRWNGFDQSMTFWNNKKRYAYLAT